MAMSDDLAKRGFSQIQYRLGRFSLADLVKLEADREIRWEIRQEIAPGHIVKLTIQYEKEPNVG